LTGSNRGFVAPIVGILMGLILAACGGTSEPVAAPSSASASPAVAASAAAAPARGAASTTATTGKIPGHDKKLDLTKPLPPLSPVVTVKARVGNSTTTAPFWYALDRGYFDQLGIKFEVVNIVKIPDLVPPLATGQLDVAGAAGGPGIYNAINRGIAVTAQADNGKLMPGLSGAAAVVKHGASGYGSDWCALKGKTIGGIDPAANFYTTMVKALQSCNLTVKDVKLPAAIPFPVLNQAIANGSVDVGFQVDPFVTAGVAQGIIDKWKPAEDAWPNQQMNFLLYSPEFVKKSDAALRFMVAYVAGIREYNAALAPGGNKQEFAELIAAHLGGTAQTYLSINPTGVDKTGQIDLASTKEELQIFQNAGSIPAGPINLDWVKSDILKQAKGYLPS